ncbi:SMI1/KNR4 family protein [Actinomadura rupiterrae]|uniref:SMI1/KNR4 family protein n=1 Tax=Actinomadura rupiterrae TaxID=559627 RepID=UPI0020A48F45|nr:SMI1/KNR4 family protein [Actinomadura rupiterrae]MCP2336923.1 hypothetical protein [Actinomadura rupiterrae]
MSDWGGVRERVEALAAHPRGHEVFGARGHRFVLMEPLTEPELADLEAQLGVRLPEDYRDFLLQVGAGGAGPCYGVFPVQKKDGLWAWAGDGADLADLARTAEPFPVEGPAQADIDALHDECPDEEAFDGIDGFDEAYEAWDARLADLLWNPDRTVGAIVLCHQGCAQRLWLVVSGPEAGHMWTDYRVDDQDLAPMVGPQGEPVTFFAWYMDWLDEATRTLAGHVPSP